MRKGKFLFFALFLLSVLQGWAEVDPKVMRRVEVYQQKVKQQPDWLVSRLQMY